MAGKHKREVHTIRNERLKEVLRERNLKQRMFLKDNYDESDPLWRDAFASSSEVSEIVNGVRELTEYNAKRFIAIGLPDIRLKYLMGDDDYKTESDKMLADAAKDNYYQDREFHALKALLEAKGYYLSKGCVFTPGEGWTEDETRNAVREHSIYMFHKGTDLIASLDQKQFDRLVADSQKLIAVLIDRL